MLGYAHFLVGMVYICLTMDPNNRPVPDALLVEKAVAGRKLLEDGQDEIGAYLKPLKDQAEELERETEDKSKTLTAGAKAQGKLENPRLDVLRQEYLEKERLLRSKLSEKVEDIVSSVAEHVPEFNRVYSADRKVTQPGYQAAWWKGSLQRASYPYFCPIG